MTIQAKKNVEGKLSMQSHNTRQWNAHVESTMKKSKIMEEKLRKENELLKEQLENMQRSINVNKSVELSNEINALSVQYDKYLKELDAERRKIEALRQHETFLDDKIIDARIDMGGVNVSKENNMLIGKQIKVLENRLEKALVKFNEAIAGNKKLRDKIENLRQERMVFDNIYKKMEKELHKKKDEMAQIIESSNEAYEERDKINNQLKVLRMKREEEMLKFDEQLKELDKIIQKDNEVNEKLKLKDRERRERDILGGMSMDEEERLKRQVVRGNWTLAEQKAKHQVNTEKSKYYEDSFKKIEAATGLTLDELIEKFSAAEDSNFSLFTYVNELNAEIEKLEEQIAELEDELKKYKGDGEASDSSAQKKKILSDLQSQVSSMESKAEQLQNKYSSTSGVVQGICSVIRDIFEVVKCDPKVVSELLGTADVTESNLMVYLGIIEQQTNELLQARQFAEKGSSQDLVIGPRHQFGAVKLKIDAPSTGGDENEDEDSEDEEKPLTREELIKKNRSGRSKSRS